MENKSCALILSGGEGKRMKSNKPKAMSEVLFKPMLQWVIDAVRGAGIEDICLVTGFKHEIIENYISTLPYHIETVIQTERLGTGHAVMTAKEFLKSHSGKNVLVLNGDAPFIDSETIKQSAEFHSNNGCTVISAELENPFGYGRIIRTGKSTLEAIVEEKEADDFQRAVKEVNSGAYWFNVDSLLSALDKLVPSEKTGEYYLTDTVQIIKRTDKTVSAFKAASSDSVLGANDCSQLAQLNEIARNRIIEKHLANGVNIPCRDGVMIGCDVKIEAGATILPASIIIGNAVIKAESVIGPAAYIK